MTSEVMRVSSSPHDGRDVRVPMPSALQRLHPRVDRHPAPDVVDVRTIPGIHALVAEIDDLLVDLWGVIHDGERPYGGAVDALERIAALPDKRVLFLTNTSRTREAVIRTLVETMGIDRRLFLDVVSSGDVTRAALVDREPSIFDGLPPAPRAFHHGDASFVPWLFGDELPLRWTDRVEDADLVVATGAAASRDAVDAALAALRPALARGARLVCTNPDRVIPRPHGAVGIGPGEIAHQYASMGGEVVLLGKPHPPIYAAARRRLGGGDRRLLAVGDLIDTDIRGARAAGMPSLLVTRGRGDWQTANISPDHVVERFAW